MDPFQREVLDRLTRIESHLSEVREDKKDHETRLRTLEFRSWSFAGFAGLLGSALTALVNHTLGRH
jgi:hypothetical protein